MLLLMLSAYGMADMAYAGDLPDAYLQLHDKAATDAAALKQLQAMAGKGDPQAQFCLADLYKPGLARCAVDTLTEQKVSTLKQDYKTAMQWYRKSAMKGNGFAADELADLYVGVEGVIPEDMVQAAQWWMVAIDLDPDGGGFDATISFGAVRSGMSQEQLDKARNGADKLEAQIMKHKPAATPAPAAAS